MGPDFLQSLKARLRQTYSQHEADAILFWMIEETVGLSRTEVITNRLCNIDSQLSAQLLERVGRVADGEPVQYVLGFTDFCGLRIAVAPGVLIPRPETEELVSLSFSLLPRTDDKRHVRIIDLCTGSGCIALAMKHHVPNASVEGWDLSDTALDVARNNANRLNLDVRFEKADITSPPAPTLPPDTFTLLVSNPPYVCESERADMERNVLEHEPDMALFVPDDDPLRFYRAIALWGQRLLCQGGWLAVEINRRFGRDVAELLIQNGYTDVRVHQDFAHNDRFVTARKQEDHTPTKTPTQHP